MARFPRAKKDKEPALLHWTQKFFWFSAAISLLLATSGFAWRVWQGKAASIEWGHLRISSEQAETLVAGAKDRLIMIRTALNDATSTNNMQLLERVLPDLDEVLKSLGVAENALRKQQKVFWDSTAAYDVYEELASPTPATDPKPSPQRRP
jgi:hypothetical protein